MKLIAVFACGNRVRISKTATLAAIGNGSARDGCATRRSCRLFPFRSATLRKSESLFAMRDGRQHRQFDELAAFSQAVVRKSWFVRQALWAKTEHLTPEQWSAMAPEYRSKLWDGPIGRLPKSSVAAQRAHAQILDRSAMGWI